LTDLLSIHLDRRLAGGLTAEQRPRALDVQLTDDEIRMLEEPCGLLLPTGLQQPSMTSSTATALAPHPQRRPDGGCDRAPSCLPYIAGVAKEAGVSNAQLLSILASRAVDSLSGTHYAIADAIDHVPSKPGLYAVYADP
jgi:hypothetical protein